MQFSQCFLPSQRDGKKHDSYLTWIQFHDSACKEHTNRQTHGCDNYWMGCTVLRNSVPHFWSSVWTKDVPKITFHSAPGIWVVKGRKQSTKSGARDKWTTGNWKTDPVFLMGIRVERQGGERGDNNKVWQQIGDLLIWKTDLIVSLTQMNLSGSGLVTWSDKVMQVASLLSQLIIL